jgi:CBS domain-containing protein
MTRFDIATAQGSMLMPRFERASVRDAMRHGLISCEAETPVRAVARMMAGYHVHAVVVALDSDAWGVVAAADLLHIVDSDREALNAGEIAATEYVTVDAETALPDAAQLMREHEVTHLIVVSDGRPVGVLSTLDIAGALAWGEA